MFLKHLIFTLICWTLISVTSSSQSQAKLLDILNTNNAFTPSPISGDEGIGPYRPAHECQLALIPSSDQLFKQKMKAVREATQSIDLQFLIFRGDESGWELTEELIRKHRAGVRVRIIVDAISNPEPATQIMLWYLRTEGINIEGFEFLYTQYVDEMFQPTPDFIFKNQHRIRKMMQSWKFIAEASFNWLKSIYRSPFRANKRYHDKLLIVDAGTPNAIAFTGGTNWALEYFRMGLQKKYMWRDQDVAVKGAIINDLAATFERNMRYLEAIKESRLAIFNTDVIWGIGNAVTKFFVTHVFPPAVRALDKTRRWRWFLNQIREAEAKIILDEPVLELEFKNTEARFIQSRPRLRERFITDAYLHFLNSAEKELILVNAYFVPIPEVREALKSAAQRGVKVTIITNSITTNDSKLLTILSRYHYQELIEAGIDVREWGAHPEESTIHAKFAVADRSLAFVGSYNLDPRSHLFNSETGILFNNPELTQELADHAMTVDLPLSHSITLNQAQAWHRPRSLPHLAQLLLARMMRPMF